MNNKAGWKQWAIVPEDPDNPKSPWTAKCRCGWTERHDTYWRARTATMSHYYVCPKRWEAFEDDGDLSA